jgi:hypothetical protein
MHRVNEKFERVQRFRRTEIMSIGLFLLLMGCVTPSLAQKSTPKTFSSAEAASHALVLAVQSNDEEAIAQVLGGGKELVSSDDEIEDKADRERFAQKYQEMHRFVKEPDGTIFLYIGAENWPFPVPLVSKAGKWHFEPEAGAKEILFRRIGENEATAIETCHALVSAGKTEESNSSSDDPVTQYASVVLNAKSGSAANDAVTSTPFHGYFFRSPSGQAKGSSASKSGFAFVAYPADYRSSGVMTFVVAQDGAVYETDLGPDTEKIASGLTVWKPSSHWHVAE